jgi:hypothetical protein
MTLRYTSIMEFVSNGGTTLFPRNELQQIRLPNPSTVLFVIKPIHQLIDVDIAVALLIFLLKIRSVSLSDHFVIP